MLTLARHFMSDAHPQTCPHLSQNFTYLGPSDTQEGHFHHLKTREIRWMLEETVGSNTTIGFNTKFEINKLLSSETMNIGIP